jgi:flagellar basal-body rod protein FlgB
MISPLFADAQYQALKATLDVSAARHKALAGNIANVNTPSYHRQDISPLFQQELQKAIQSGDMEKLQALNPKVETDASALALRADGNTVNLEREMVEMTKNSTQYEVASTFLAKKYASLRMAITGK